MTEQIMVAVRRLAVLKFFPSDAVVRQEIMALLDRLVSTPEQLEWLVSALINEVGEWPGPKEVRGIFCTRFRPKDGIETDAEHNKFSPITGEMRMLAIEPPTPQRLIAGGTEKASVDPKCRELVETTMKALPAIRVRESDKRAAREWAERMGLA